jgi:hypothetical protein
MESASERTTGGPPSDNPRMNPLERIKTSLFSTEWWAAVAAIAAAITAWLTFMEQREGARDAIRPELVLSSWRLQLAEADKQSQIAVGTVENIGNGPAFNVLIRGPSDPELVKRQLTESRRISVLPKDTEQDLNIRTGVLMPADDRGRR